MTRLPISIVEFESQEEIDSFSSIDDRAMGGIFSSSMSPTENGVALFHGTASLANNGGFASIRAPLNCPDLTAASAVKLRVKGDGNSYKLRLCNSATFDSVAYEQAFRPIKGIWQEAPLPFASLTPAWRGSIVADSPKFQKGQTCPLGFMISERQVGEFELF